jgi:hypothetical protein
MKELRNTKETPYQIIICTLIRDVHFANKHFSITYCKIIKFYIYKNYL